MYLEIDEDFPTHPKSMRIGVLLGNPVAWAYVQKLWVFACKYQKDGDLSAYSPEEIEGFVGWPAADGKFYAAAVKVGFIDEREGDGGRWLHNWKTRQGRWLDKMEADRRRKADSRAPVQRTSSGQGADKTPPVHRTDPVPHLTSPDLTKPNQTKVVDGVSDSDAPRNGLDLLRLFGRLWERRWSLLFVQKQWDPKAADTLIDAAPDPLRRELKPAIEAFLRSDDEQYLDGKHPFQLFARDLDRFRGGASTPGRRKPRELELA
jgi:hypothetical protein